MNIYFACSITGGRKFESVYQAIIESLSADGHIVPTAHLAASDVKVQEGQLSPNEVFERDAQWIRECKILVAEVSTPSHGVGYEIAYALSIGKAVLCLYQTGQPVTKMLTGNSDPNIQVSAYADSADCTKIMREWIGKFQS